MNADVQSKVRSFARRCFVLLAVLPFCAAWGAGAERVPRRMHIHRVEQLGLEIWTEADPAWDTALNGPSVFSAETPALTYPPAGMIWVSKSVSAFADEELEGAARGAIHQAARNYGVRDVQALILKRARYGELSGYEARFTGRSHGSTVDVLVFLGHKLGRPAVLAHAYTLEGQLDHIREHIRRSWTNLRYLQ